MYFPLIVTFLLLMGLVIAAIQNTAPVEFRFMMWTLELSITALIFYSAVLGGAIVAVLSLPKLARHYLRNRSFRRETGELKERLARMERQSEESGR
ncbi:MAG: lipopolysaccharide assembly LapA domain-containing protein [Desulfobacteraceae bacterium]